MRRTAVCVAALLACVAPVGASSTRVRSPIFGINLSMYGPNAADQFVDDRATRALFAGLDISLVRVPIRPGVSDRRLKTAMRAVSNTGATPVIILHGPVLPDALALDLHLLAVVKSVYGSRTVYLEIGNEEDNSGVTAAQYTAGWNTIVPQLRARSPQAYRYGGPVTYFDDVRYIAYFARHAVPRPGFISWHEYVCGAQSSDQYCDAHIAKWAAHVAATNRRVRAAIHRTLPIMISEWNLDPYSDARYTDPAFIAPWVTAALQELNQLRSHGLIGAIYYTASGNQDDLINLDRSLTPAGAAWARAALLAANAQPFVSGVPGVHPLGVAANRQILPALRSLRQSLTQYVRTHAHLHASWRGVSEEPCKRGRKDQPCLRELTAGSVKKKILLSARSEATSAP